MEEECTEGPLHNLQPHLASSEVRVGLEKGSVRVGASVRRRGTR